MDFTEWLQNELNIRQWSNAELSRRAGVSRARITQVLSGDSPGADFCVGIARGLGINPVLVLRRAGILPNAPGDTDDPWLTSAWQLIQQTPDDARRWVMAMLRGVVDQTP